MRKANALLIALALTGSGCADWGMKIDSTEAPAVDVSTYDRFAFMPGAAISTTQGLTAAVRAAVLRALEAKGYASAPEAEAGLLLVFYTDISDPLGPDAFDYSTRAWERAHGDDVFPGVTEPVDTAWDVGQFHDVNRYVGMALVVDAVDRTTNELVWRGWARGITDPQLINEKTIVDAAAAVMNRFPPRR